MSKKATPLAACALALSTGCSGIVSEGTIGERPVRLDGTGYAWVDETVYELDQGSIILRERASDETALRLRFTSVVFDPGVDFRTLSFAERLRIGDEMNRDDALAIDVRRGVEAGDKLMFDNTELEVPESGPYIEYAALSLGSDPLTKESEYPDTIERPGSGLRVSLTLNEVEPRVLGEVTVEVFAIDGEADQDEVAEGEVELRFDVELLPERLAECNFDPAGAGEFARPCDTLELGADG